MSETSGHGSSTDRMFCSGMSPRSASNLLQAGLEYYWCVKTTQTTVPVISNTNAVLIEAGVTVQELAQS